MGRAVVDHPEHAPRRRVGLGGHHLFDKPTERLDTGGGLAAPEHLGAMDVPGGEVLKGTSPVVLVLDACRPPRRRPETFMAADAGLDGGLLVGRDDEVALAERLCLPLPRVEVEHPRRFGLEVGIAREDPGAVLDLYARQWQAKPLGKRDFVVSSDEKTSIQARVRRHESLGPAPRRATRVEHEYDRGGALQYLAAWDVHRAKVFGRCEPATGIEPFGRLVEQVMTTEPYASARRVFWVVDNGSSHRGNAACARMTKRWPNALLVQLPVHASWLNQVEIYFSVIQRKVLTPNDFADLAEVESRLAAFERRYERAAEPFEWRFTRDDLALLMNKLADRPDDLAA